VSTEIELQIMIAAPRELVFRYFTDPGRVAAWLGPGSVIGDREGGEVRVCYAHGDVALGRVEKLVAPERIEFTWGYEESRHGLAPGQSRVTVRLETVGDGTRVTLRHGGLEAGQLPGQKAGWRYLLSRLSGLVLDDAMGEVLPTTLQAYFQAWNESDAAQRAALLETSCAADVSFRDAMSFVHGRSELNELIGVAQSMSRGIRLEWNSASQHCKGAVLFGWRMVGPDGTEVAHGVNAGELNGAGRFRTVVGFWQP
jgi:uncharacterized protein YndB with AHSA1/START domain